MMLSNKYVGSTARVVVYTYIYVFLEWVFLVTKPSFLGVWTLTARVEACLIGVLPFLAVILAVHAGACVLAAVFDRGLEGLGRYLLKLAPALVVAAIVLMLVDNFTYTMFGWGIVKTTWYTVPLYWVLLLGVMWWQLRGVSSYPRLQPGLAAILLVLTCTALLWSLRGLDRYSGERHVSARSGKLPNIVMFAADGVNANHMSAYGYARKTTPNLDAWMDRGMVVDNAFTNSGWTTGSLTSMMTGKYPATTKVLYPPYTLQGIDAYQNLPRILGELGYTNLQETLRYYADGPDLNWKDSFELANGRPVSRDPFDQAPLGWQGPLLFVDNLYQRLSQRILQILMVRRMVDPHAEVTSTEYAKVYGLSDKTRMDRVADFIRHAEQPFFIHIHLMGTHCCNYRPRHKVFSAQSFEDDEARKIAAFDDTILESDQYFGQMMAQLQSRNLLDNTLVIYTSDHTSGWDFRTQVPLVFLFPGAEHRGHVSTTIELIDVAPTVLDYLQVPVPAWMEGKSLLGSGFERNRPVFSIYRVEREHFETEENDRLARTVNMGPPTYGLSLMGLVVCQRWYIMNLKTRSVIGGNISEYRDKCPAALLPDKDEAAQMMTRHLNDRGIRF